MDFVKHESVLLGLQLKHGNSTDIENSITVQAIIIFEPWEVCHELIRSTSLSSIHNVHGNYSQWSRHLIHSQDSQFRVISVQVAFMVGRVAVGQVFCPEYFGFSPVNTIPPVLHTLINSSITYAIQHYQLTALCSTNSDKTAWIWMKGI